MTSPSLTPGAANFWMDQRPSETLHEPESPAGPSLSPEDYLSAYRRMLLVRRFEEKAGQLYGMGYIGGFCHLYIGQEAVVTGMMMAKRYGDQVITSYRDHGHMLATGMDPKGVMAELTGRRSGYSKGKGGSMHMFSVEKGFYGGHGIVGTPAPLGTGLAFANKYRGNGNVCLTFFGEGAANQGQVYESFNMASLWKLPVLYIIENNSLRHGHGRRTRHGPCRRALSSRPCLRHSRTPDRRHGRRRRQDRWRGSARIRAKRQWPHDPGGADLSLSRALHVRPGEIPDARRGPGHAPAPRSHRARSQASRRARPKRRRAQGHRQRNPHDRQRSRPAFAQDEPEPDPSELWTDVVASEG